MAYLLIVDDEAHIRWIFSKILQEEGHRVENAESGREALKIIRAGEPDLVFLDYRMKGMDGLQVLRAIKKEGFICPVIMITAYESIRSAVSSIQEGAFDYLTKPLNNDEILYHTNRALDFSHLSRQVHECRSRISELMGPDRLIGDSRAVKDVMTMLAKVAPGDISVLITGESGTGKELVAHLLHQKSGRRHGPFVTVDCGAIPETLVESELFGHEKGAFTGADRKKPGKFELADGGTLFLDEISNASPGMQAKVLRSIEEKQLHRLGSKVPLDVDVRIISATNQPLEALVEKGGFRQDLFFRLKGIELFIPPLRERPEDIPYLARYFIERFSGQQHKPAPQLDRKAMKALSTYHWPGNIRELRNVIERAVLLSDGMILEDHLPAGTVSGLRGQKPKAGTLREVREQALAETERHLILETLSRCRGNKRAAAREMNIDPKTLYRLLKKYGIN